MAAAPSGEAVMLQFCAEFGEAAFMAASEVLAPLLEQRTAANTASSRLLHARATELAQRSVALAEATLPADSLVVVHVRSLHLTEIMVASAFTLEQVSADGWTERVLEQHDAAWRDNPRVVSLSRSGLETMGRRWRSGTLNTLSAEERLYFGATPSLRARGAAERLWTYLAAKAVCAWPPAALDAAALRDVKDAVCALLEADARGELPTGADLPRPGESDDPVSAVFTLCEGLLGGARRSLRTKEEQAQLLRDSGLTKAQAQALEGVRTRLQASILAHNDMHATLAATQVAMDGLRSRAVATASARLAKHGLQRCTLPSCAVQEPSPRTYKRFGRCHAVYYCCADHSKADWKRHKHEDGCKASAEGAT